MSWIQTFTGRQFFPAAPRAMDIDIRDIAHSLAMQCRFNGHCARFYSVAEHSVRVSRAVGLAWAMWGLLHDAAEAYVGDLPRPVKQQLPAFSTMEDRILREIVSRFGLSWPMPDAVREADDMLLVTECRDLMLPPPAPWGIVADPLAERIEPVPGPPEAERLFLDRFHALSDGMQ
jgi:hypothetical protein